MSSKAADSPSRPNYLSPEECQEMFRDFTPNSWQIDIPDHHKEILEERIARYCKEGVEFTPWEEFEKKLLERLKELKRLMKS